MGQDDIYRILRRGKELCSEDVAKQFNMSRQHASMLLAKVEISSKDIGHHWIQRRFGDRICSVKYYGLKVKLKL